MNTSIATTDHWPEIERFLNRARHVYADTGREDLLGLIRSGVVVVGRDRRENQHAICALLAFKRESRPSTLPADAPDRESLRYAALASKRSAVTDLPMLMERAWPWLSERGNHFQVQAYGSQRWIVNPLLASGFVIDERIEFLRLTDLQRRTAPAVSLTYDSISPADTVTMRPAAPDELALLAQLDAAAFPSRWHFGEEDLFTLLFGGKVQLAFIDGELAGYWAQTQTAEREAHLARLAVHPTLHGRGVGRYLLTDAIEYARAEKFQSILLNTQTDNERAQSLYRTFGFRPTGRIVPILARAGADVPKVSSSIVD